MAGIAMCARSSFEEWNARKNWNIIKNPGRRTQMAPSEWQARCQNHFTQFKTAKEEGGKLFKITSAKLNKIGQWGNLSIKLSDLLTLGCHFEWPNLSFWVTKLFILWKYIPTQFCLRLSHQWLLSQLDLGFRIWVTESKKFVERLG